MALSAIAFFLMYFALSFFNRLGANEDVMFIALIKNKGLIETTSWIYNTWTGRWASTIYFYSIMSFIKSFQNIHYFLFIYHCTTFIILLYSIFFILKTIVSRLFMTTLENKIILTYSTLFIGGFYFSTFQISEVWWWIYGGVDHLQGIVFLLFGTALLIKENKKLIHYLLLCLSFIYVGGSYEIYNLIAIPTILFTFFAYKRSITKQNLTRGFYLGIVSILIASSISFLAPGNQARRKQEAANTSASTTIFATSIHLTDFAQKKTVVAIGIASLFLLLGIKIKSNSQTLIDRKKIKTIVSCSFVLLLVSFIIPFLFQLIFLHNFLIPQRGWTFTSLALEIFCCSLFLIAGYSLNFSETFLKPFVCIAFPFLVFVALSAYLYSQYSSVSLYAKQYDELIDKLNTTKENKEIKILEVNKLNSSGMLMPLEMETEFLNDGSLRNILNLNFEVRLKE